MTAALWMSVNVTLFLQSTTVPKTSKANAFGGGLQISILAEDIADENAIAGKGPVYVNLRVIVQRNLENGGRLVTHPCWKRLEIAPA